MTARERTKNLTLYILSLLAVLALLGAPIAGMKIIPFDAIFHPVWGQADTEIFWKIRVPRVLLSFLAGSGLAMSGMAFQALFRNPLATPYTMGVSSGASLGAAIYLRTGMAFSILGAAGISIAAFLGACISVFLVYGITRSKKECSTATMLLAGVAIGLCFSSAILLIQYKSGLTDSFRILRWLMGGLEVGTYQTVLNLLPFVAVGSGIIFCLLTELNLIACGEDIALSRGLDIHKVRKLLFFATSFMVGGIVSVCGPIGFIGMMVPHICRLFVGPEHRFLAPASLLFGGTFLALCDILSRTLIAPAELPVGIITSLLGGPFFIWLLLDQRLDRRTLE